MRGVRLKVLILKRPIGSLTPYPDPNPVLIVGRGRDGLENICTYFNDLSYVIEDFQ